MAFTFAQPLLVERVLTYLGDKDDRSGSVGYGLLVAYGLVYLGIAVSESPMTRTGNSDFA